VPLTKARFKDDDRSLPVDLQCQDWRQDRPRRGRDSENDQSANREVFDWYGATSLETALTLKKPISPQAGLGLQATRFAFAPRAALSAWR
jgi:hypothetical protein